MSYVTIPAEYLIGNLLIANKAKFPITYQMIMDLTDLIYEKTNNVYIESWTDDVDNAIYKYSDYFVKDLYRNISTANDITIDNLENRFWGYLPLNIILLINECSKTIINNYLMMGE